MSEQSYIESMLQKNAERGNYEVIPLPPLDHGFTVELWIRVHHEFKNWKHLFGALREYQRIHYPKSVQYMPKTKRPRKVHFVWADTNNVKCEVRETTDTLYSKWAPDVTCTVCRQLMINRGLTRIL